MADIALTTGVARLRAAQGRYPARTIRLNELDWRIRDTGGAAPALLLLPGGLGNADIFFNQLLDLPPEIRCIAVDYPDAACDRLADDLVLLLDALGLRRACLLGSSLAGYWLQTFGARHSDRVDAMILANSFCRSEELRQHPLFSVAALTQITGDRLKAQWLAMLEERPPSDLRDVQIVLLQEGQEGTQLRSRLLAAATASDAPLIPRGEFPLFLLDCADDPLLKAAIRAQMASRYPDAMRLTLSAGGHYPCATQPLAYNSFLRGAVPDCCPAHA